MVVEVRGKRKFTLCAFDMGTRGACQGLRGVKGVGDQSGDDTYT